MSGLRVSSLAIYPVKSLAGIAVSEVSVSSSGLQADRRWMLVDESGSVITQRQHPLLSRFSTKMAGDSIEISFGDEHSSIPQQLRSGEQIRVTIWGHLVTAIRGSRQSGDWFSRLLGMPCVPVYLPEDELLPVDPDYAPDYARTAFSDGFPILIVGSASLSDLNTRLASPIEMSRFRPNLVIDGARPYEESEWGLIQAGTVELLGVKPCSRCSVTTVDPSTGQTGLEPLRTLSTYRRRGSKVYFGENYVVASGGRLRIGDRVIVRTRRDAAGSLTGQA
jgi:uncharacterized protein YcbX